jgi:hypothetical protein
MAVATPALILVGSIDMIAKEDVMSYEDKIAKVLKVYGDVEQAWRNGKISLFTLNDLSDILDEYTDMVEERM